jgi:hypothetical protein
MDLEEKKVNVVIKGQGSWYISKLIPSHAVFVCFLVHGVIHYGTVGRGGVTPIPISAGITTHGALRKRICGLLELTRINCSWPVIYKPWALIIFGATDWNFYVYFCSINPKIFTV